MTEEEMIRRGVEVYMRTNGPASPKVSAEHVDPKSYGGLSMKMFNDYWGGIEELSMRDKRLIVMGQTMAEGEWDAFAIHCECAILNGELTAEEVLATVLMGLPYGGFARGTSAMQRAAQVIAKVKETSAAKGEARS